jgi:hypothetical protein
MIMFVSTCGKDNSVISRIAENIKNDPTGIDAQKASFVLATKILNYKIRKIDLGGFNTRLSAEGLPSYCFETHREEGYSRNHRDSPVEYNLDSLVKLVEVSEWNPFVHEKHLISLLGRTDTYFEGDNLRVRFENGDMRIYPDEAPCVETSLYILFSYWDRGIITDEDLTKDNPKIGQNKKSE